MPKGLPQRRQCLVPRLRVIRQFHELAGRGQAGSTCQILVEHERHHLAEPPHLTEPLALGFDSPQFRGETCQPLPLGRLPGPETDVACPAPKLAGGRRNAQAVELSRHLHTGIGARAMRSWKPALTIS
jgi:hypothetical protein